MHKSCTKGAGVPCCEVPGIQPCISQLPPSSHNDAQGRSWGAGGASPPSSGWGLTSLCICRRGLCGFRAASKGLEGCHEPKPAAERLDEDDELAVESVVESAWLEGMDDRRSLALRDMRRPLGIWLLRMGTRLLPEPAGAITLMQNGREYCETLMHHAGRPIWRSNQ